MPPPARVPLPRNVWLLGAASFLADVSGDLLAAILPFFVLAIGGTAVAVGFLGGIGDAVAQFVKIPAGRWSDARGTRRPLVLLGYGVAALGKLALALSTTVPFATGARALDRVGKGLRGPPRDALLAESVDAPRRGRAFGLHRTLDSAGAVVGVALALLLLSRGFAFRSAVLLSAALGVLALLPLLLIRERRRDAKASARVGLALARLPPRLARYLVAAALFGAANVTVFLFTLRAGESFPAVEVALGGAALYGLFTLANALGAYPAGALSDRVGRKPVLVAGFALFVVVALGFATASAPWALAVFIALLGLVYAAVDGNERAFAADLAAEGDRGAIIGTLATVTGVAGLVGGVGAGFLLATFGPLVAFGALAGLGALALVALAFV